MMYGPTPIPPTPREVYAMLMATGSRIVQRHFAAFVMSSADNDN